MRRVIRGTGLVSSAVSTVTKPLVEPETERAGAPSPGKPMEGDPIGPPAADASASRSAEAAVKPPQKPRHWSPDLFAAAYNHMARHGGDGLAAGLAFGALLSSAPLLLLVLVIAGGLLGEGTARDEVLYVVRGALGTRPSELVAGWIDETGAWSARATLLGVGFFIFGAGRLALLVDAAFQVVFEVQPPAVRPRFRDTVTDFLRLHSMSFLVTLGAGLLLVLSLVVRTSVFWVFGEDSDAGDSTARFVTTHALSFGFLFASVALVYRLLPPVRLEVLEVLEGALVTTVLLELGLWILRALGRALDLGAAYGAASAIVGTLIALYGGAQAFLYGAELTAELRRRRRKARGA